MKSIKYDPEAWFDVKATKFIPCPKQVHIRLSKPGTVKVDQNGEVRLIGYGDEFKITLTTEGKITADVDYTVYIATDTIIEQIGVPLTNFDKRPGMSAVERMIKTQFKEQQLIERSKAEKRKEHDRETNKLRMQQGLQETTPIEDEENEDETLDETSQDGTTETATAV